jgi:hypothetical protein
MKVMEDNIKELDRGFACLILDLERRVSALTATGAELSPGEVRLRCETEFPMFDLAASGLSGSTCLRSGAGSFFRESGSPAPGPSAARAFATSSASAVYAAAMDQIREGGFTTCCEGDFTQALEASASAFMASRVAGPPGRALI